MMTPEDLERMDELRNAIMAAVKRVGTGPVLTLATLLSGAMSYAEVGAVPKSTVAKLMATCLDVYPNE